MGCWEQLKIAIYWNYSESHMRIGIQLLAEIPAVWALEVVV